MNEIDPATGMAPLGDGSYWEVFKDGMQYQGQNIYRLRMVLAYQKQVKRWKWYGKSYTKTVTKLSKAFVTPIWNSDAGGRYDSGYAPVITPTHLRNASFRALDEYTAEIAKLRRQAALVDNSKELLGEYPPKTLNLEGSK